MSTFTLEQFSHPTKQKLYKLSRDETCFYEEFVETIKSDPNLKPELGDLWAILKDVANGKQVPKTKYRREKIGKKVPYPVYAAKSKHLRLYLFTDENGMIIIIGGKKTEQDEDLDRCKQIVKEYDEFIKTKK